MTKQVNYFNMLRIAFRLSGVSVRENESSLYLTVTFVLVFVGCVYPFLALYDVFIQDFEVVAEILKYDITLFVGVVKIISLRQNRVLVGRLFDKLEKEPFLENMERGGEKEGQLIKQFILITTIQTIIYWVVTFTTYSLDVGYTLLKRINSNDYNDWGFPFGPFTLFDATRSPNFEISWFYQSVSSGWIAVVFTTVDATIAAVMVHLCYQLKILQHFLNDVVAKSREKMLQEKRDNTIPQNLNGVLSSENVQLQQVEWKYLNKTLKEAVEYHLAIISAANETNETFGVLLLMVFLGTLAILSFMVYKVSLVSMNDPRMLRSIGEIVIITLQVVLVCFWGEQLMFESEEVGRAAFRSDFVGTDLRFQKGLTLIVRRSQTPIKLTAGKFVDIGLGALTRIVRSTYSAFMVLRKRNLST